MSALNAQALPLILAELKAKGYKIVHMKAKAPVVTLAEFDEAIEKEAKGLPQVGAERPMSSVVKTVGGAAPKDDAAGDATEPEGMPAPAAVEGAHAPASEGTASAPLPAFPSAASPAEKPSVAPEASPPSGTAPGPGKQSSNEPSSAISGDSAAAPAAQATQPSASSATAPVSPPSMTTASVVRTISGNEEATPSAPTEPVAKSEAPHEPHKSLMQRAKETWKLWFGD